MLSISEQREVKGVEDNERWPEADIEAIADLLSSCGDQGVFEKEFYPFGKKPWIPSSVLNRAVRKLPGEKYEEIKLGLKRSKLLLKMMRQKS